MDSLNETKEAEALRALYSLDIQKEVVDSRPYAVEVIVREVQEEDEELLLIHFNKQKIKSFKELINEYLTLDNLYRKGQGKRTDLTSVKSNISSSRDIISSEMGISSSQLWGLF